MQHGESLKLTPEQAAARQVARDEFVINAAAVAGLSCIAAGVSHFGIWYGLMALGGELVLIAQLATGAMADHLAATAARADAA